MDDLLHHNEALLIRYLDGDLTTDEKLDLEMRLQTDKTLGTQLANLRVAIQAIKQFGTTQQVASVHTQMMKELKPKKAKTFSINRTVRFTMAVAASLFILFIGVRLYLSAQLSPEKLYDEAFVDFNISGTRANGTVMSEIETHYQKMNYAAATNAIRSNNLYAKDSLLVGLSFLHLERINQAIGFFQKIAFSDNDFRQDAEFYLALSLLKNKAYEQALPIMQKIVDDPSHLYHQQLTGAFIEKVKKLKEK